MENHQFMKEDSKRGIKKQGIKKPKQPENNE